MKREFDLKAYLSEKRAAIDAALANRFPDKGDKTPRVMDAMRYSTMAGGKRLRPILCLAAAGAVGGSDATVMPAACALELIHTYSLIHDDLPAMDDDDLRRGMPTNHRQFDEATAVLAGDGLLTLAFEVLAAGALTSRVPYERWLAVIREMAAAAGCRGMIEGQMRDIAAERCPVDLDDLEALHGLKTGALIRVSVRSGAILAGGDVDAVRSLTRYADWIGLAFQVKDDILNVEGDAARMGKAVGTDESRNKSTYPALMGLAESKRFAEKLVAEAVESLRDLGSRAEPLRAIALYVMNRNR